MEAGILAMAELVRIAGCDMWHGDCREVLPQLPGFDLILTDPPYGIGVARKPLRGAYESMDWDAEPPAAWVFGLMQEKAKHLIVWGGNYFGLPRSSGFLVWDKIQPENFSLSMCEQAWCSFPIPSKLRRVSVGSYKRQHQTQKPVCLMEWCISYAPEAESICDPYMGSGTTGVACVNLGKKFTGIERERSYFDIACERIESAAAQGKLALEA